MVVIDPVCGMQVNPEKAAAKVEYEGTVYYFCSSHCAEAFSANPGRYAVQKAPDTHGGHGHHGGGCCH